MDGWKGVRRGVGVNLLTDVGSITTARGERWKGKKKSILRKKSLVLLCYNCALVFPAGVDEHQLPIA
jgi:hypothetical protein